MKRLFLNIVVGLSFLAFSHAALSADKGSADEVVALVKKAVAFQKANGTEKAVAEFNKPKGQFVDRDLYVFAIDSKGTTLANAVNPRLIGKNVMELKDSDGKPFIKNLFDVANAKGSGWVEYNWPNPVTKSIALKATYVEKAGDLLIACGIYK